MIIKLSSPDSLKEVIKSEKNFKRIPNFKLAEFKYSFEKHQDDTELTFSRQTEAPRNQLVELNTNQTKLYWTFYDELYKLVNKEFILSSSIIELIEKYWDSELLSSSKLVKLASLALRTNASNECYLSVSELSNLINEELESNQKEFNWEEYNSFWQNIHTRRDKKELNKLFESLFSNYSEITFYLKLTKKKQAPAKLEQWIQDCIKKQIERPIINGMMSFVCSLLKKIPINYLIKMSDNLINDGINTIDQFLTHLKGFAKHELKNKNRFKVLTSSEVTR